MHEHLLRQPELLETRRCLTAVFHDEFSGTSHAIANQGVEFTADTAVFASHDDGLEFADVDEDDESGDE